MYDKTALTDGMVLSILSAYDYYLDALFNYKEQRYAVCKCLITTSREEVGKARILSKKIKTMKSHESLSKKEIFKLYSDHIQKIMISLSIIAVPLSKSMLENQQKAIKEGSSEELNKVTDEFIKCAKILRKTLPNDIHQKRLEAQYVNAIGEGKWSSRHTINIDDCTNELIHLGHEIFADIGFLLENINDQSEFKKRYIDFNTIHMLQHKQMLEILNHNNISKSIITE